MAVLSPGDIESALRELGGWTYDGSAIAKTFKRNGFTGAMAFAVQVALIAQAEDHHPDIDIRWDSVTLTFSTHSEGGVTENDLKLARMVDSLS